MGFEPTVTLMEDKHASPYREWVLYKPRKKDNICVDKGLCDVFGCSSIIRLKYAWKWIKDCAILVFYVTNYMNYNVGQLKKGIFLAIYGKTG